MKTLSIGVLMGGKSIEKEVSLNSGRTVCDHLDTTRFEVVPLFLRQDGALFILPWQFLYRGTIKDFAHRLDAQAQRICWDDLSTLIDFLYLAMPGRYGEDGIVQGVLELFGIPYLGSGILASALCMDKIMLKTVLRQHAIAVPKDITVSAQHIIAKKIPDILKKLAEKKLTFPLVVKPHMEGSSLGISVVTNEMELDNALTIACFVYPEKPQAVLIEEKIEGMEFSCVTLWDYKTNKPLPLPPTEIVVESGTSLFDYEQKYMPGRATKFTPPRCNTKTVQAIHDACLKTMNALEIKTIARIDGFVKKDGTVIIVDPNTLSGMAPNSFLFREAAECGMGHRQLINHLIDTELVHYGLLTQIKNKQKSMKKKKRIAVLFGGRSREREISLESGRNVCYKLAYQYDVIPLFVCSDLKLHRLSDAHLVRNSTKEIEPLVDKANTIPWSSLPMFADFVFIALHGGEGENGTVHGMLEMLELPYNGSGVLTSALCMNKIKAANFLKQEGFFVPNHVVVSKIAWKQDQKKVLTTIQQSISFPLIVKPHDDGCSIFVKKVENSTQLSSAITELLSHGKEQALIEEFITGMELTVGVIGNEDPLVLVPSRAVAKKGVLSIEEKFLPGEGENQTPAPLDSDALKLVTQTIKEAYQRIQCRGYARIDCFYQSANQSSSKQPRVVILEVNTLPGLTPATCLFHQAAEAGIKPLEFLDRIIHLGFEAHTIKKVSDKQRIKRTIAAP